MTVDPDATGAAEYHRGWADAMEQMNVLQAPTEPLFRQLGRPFEQRFIEVVQKGGRRENFVNHAVVTGRLNAVLGEDGWSFRITHVSTYAGPDGAPHVAYVQGALSIQGNLREEVGVPSNVEVVDRPNPRKNDETIRQTTIHDEVKGAVSDAIKRCAMRYGVAIQLWHTVEELPGGGSLADLPSAGETTTGAKGKGLEGPSDAPVEPGEGAASSSPGFTFDDLVEIAGSVEAAGHAINEAVGTRYTKTTVRSATAREVEAGRALLVGWETVG